MALAKILAGSVSGLVAGVVGDSLFAAFGLNPPPSSDAIRPPGQVLGGFAGAIAGGVSPNALSAAVGGTFGGLLVAAIPWFLVLLFR